MTETIGWISSVILLLTIGKQIHKQWRDRSSEGVSVWLFVGQLAASAGFTVYSYLVKNWVFVVTNALMVVNGLLGYLLTRRQHKEDSASEAGTHDASLQ